MILRTEKVGGFDDSVQNKVNLSFMKKGMSVDQGRLASQPLLKKSSKGSILRFKNLGTNSSLPGMSNRSQVT